MLVRINSDNKAHVAALASPIKLSFLALSVKYIFEHPITRVEKQQTSLEKRAFIR